MLLKYTKLLNQNVCDAVEVEPLKFLLVLAAFEDVFDLDSIEAVTEFWILACECSWVSSQIFVNQVDKQLKFGILHGLEVVIHHDHVAWYIYFSF